MRWLCGMLVAVLALCLFVGECAAGKTVSKSRTTYSWSVTPESTVTTTIPAEVSADTPLPVYTRSTHEAVAMETRIQATSWRTAPYGRTTRTRIPASTTYTKTVTIHSRR